MEEYKLFDELLQKSKALKNFTSDRENMLCEIIKMDIPSEGKIQWLESVGVELNRVLNFVEKLSNERKAHLNLKK